MIEDSLFIFVCSLRSFFLFPYVYVNSVLLCPVKKKIKRVQVHLAPELGKKKSEFIYIF